MKRIDLSVIIAIIAVLAVFPTNRTVSAQDAVKPVVNIT